jgi:hypothetical protein
LSVGLSGYVRVRVIRLLGNSGSGIRGPFTIPQQSLHELGDLPGEYMVTRRTVSATVALLTATAATALGAGTADAAGVVKPSFTVSPGMAPTLPVRTGGTGTAFRSVGVTFNTWGAGSTLSAAPLDGVRVAVDASSLKGTVQLQLPRGCAFTVDQLHATCSLGNLLGGSGALSVGVRATTGARAGAQGAVAFKVTAANAVEQYQGPSADSVPVNVADGPDMVISNLGTAIAAPAGRNTGLPLRLTNLGSEAAKGVVVFVRDEYGHMTIPGNADNCVYETVSGGQRGAQCTFPTAVVEPGQSVEVNTPLTLDAPAGAHGDEVFYGAGLTGDSWIGAPSGRTGTGPALTLVTVPSGVPVVHTAKSSNVDIDTNDDYAYTNLNTGVLTQISAVGGAFHGTVGKVATAWVGARNSGTSTIRTVAGIGPGLKGTVGVSVDFPGSVKVVTAPKGCKLMTAGPTAGASADGTPTAYDCASSEVLTPGASVWFGFGIRPLKAISDEFAGVYTTGLEDPNANYALDFAKLILSARKA